MSSGFLQECSKAELVPVNNLTKRSNSAELHSRVQRLGTANNPRSLAPINDINLKVFDQICEERFGALDLNVLNVNDVDNLPSDVLPHLAEQYHITGNEGWKFCKTDQDKRELIKNAINLHKYRGTKYAIIKALSLINIKSDVSEWFQYKGSPFFFKVLLDMETSYDSDLELQIIDLINENKNVRSWLERIIVHLKQEALMPIMSYISTSEEITV